MTPREITLRSTVPLVINVFNQFHYLKCMVDQFQAHGFRNILILDNNSSFPPLLDYYTELNARHAANVIFYGQNRGPHYFFVRNIYQHLLESTPFLYTDPDLGWNAISPTFLSRLFDLSNKYSLFKVGCALTVPTSTTAKPDLPHFSFDNQSYSVAQWEAQYWQELAEPDVYKAPVDTTMHLFHPKFYERGSALITGVRVAGEGMEAIHWPWFNTDTCPAEEREFFRAQTRHSSWQV